MTNYAKIKACIKSFIDYLFSSRHSFFNRERHRESTYSPSIYTIDLNIPSSLNPIFSATRRRAFGEL